MKMNNKGKIRALIVDDEVPARDIIRHYLRKHPGVEVAGEFADGFSGLKGIHKLKPDLVFLDVQMPKLTGLEMLEVCDKLPAIIFITAYDQYAVKAFEHNAVDYLLKPFTQERFDAAVEKAIHQVNAREGKEEQIRNLVNNAGEQENTLERFVVRTSSGIQIVPLTEVKYLEAVDDYVKIHTQKARHMKKMTMAYLEKRLDPEEFIRVHRSYIVPVGEISRFEKYGKESYRVFLHGGESLPMSMSGLERLKTVLGL